jgi:hypothetical protein
MAKLAELPRDSYEEYVVDAIAMNLVEMYGVSKDVLIKRITKEVEKKILKIP